MKGAGLMKLPGTWLILLLGLTVILAGTLAGGYGTAGAASRVTVVVVNRLSLSDLSSNDYLHWQRLMAQGAIGLMNTRTGGGLTPENAYTTLGAGARVVGATAAGEALMAGEKYQGERAGCVYQRRTGQKAAPPSIVVLDIEGIRGNNTTLGETRLGVIGEALHRQSQRTAVVGNADWGNKRQRWAALIAMDAWGRVDRGVVDETLLTDDPAFPTGRRIDRTALWDAYLSARSQARFIVVDPGDTERVESQWRHLAPSQYRRFHREALEAVDDFLQRLWEIADLQKEYVIIVSPVPSVSDYRAGRLLTPVIAAGPDITPGLLFSATTRRPGIITNYDLAPSILTWLGIEADISLPGARLRSMALARRSMAQAKQGSLSIAPAGHVGSFPKGPVLECSVPAGHKPLDSGESSQHKKVLTYLRDVYDRIVATYRQRPPLLKTFVSIEILIYLVVIFLIAVLPRLPSPWPKVLSFALGFVVATPLALLILPGLQPASLVAAFGYAVLIAVFLTGLIFGILPETEERYLAICSLTVLVLLVDIATGGWLMKFSPMGYDVIIGARFYGVGNEYMGVLIGASILATGVGRGRWQQKGWKRWLSLLLTVMWFLAVIYVFVSPRLGANAGGMITSAIAFPVALWAGEGAWRYLQHRDLAVMALAAVLILVLALWVNLATKGEEVSHVGRALTLLVEGKWNEIVVIINRKLAMNWKLMRYSIWSKGLLVGLGIMAFVIYRPTQVIRVVMHLHPAVGGLVIATLVASIVALAINDSGVVAGGTTSMFASALVLNLILDRRAGDKPAPG